MDRYPIRREKVEALKASIDSTTFWSNIVARPRPGHPGEFEIAYGHHRLVALRELYPPDHEIGLIVRDLDDADMIRIMAAENMQEWSTDATVVLETVRATVAAYAEGRIELDEPTAKVKDQWRYAPSFRVGGTRCAEPRVPGALNEIKQLEVKTGHSSTARPYTSREVTNFLGWERTKVKTALSALELIEEGILDEGAFVGLSPDAMRGIVEQARKAKLDKERMAAIREEEAKAEEHKAEEERKAREEAERKAAEEAKAAQRAEEERKAREEAERKAREEAKRKAEAARKAREEEERRRLAEERRKAEEEAEKAAKAAQKAEEERRRAEAERKRAEEAARKAEEQRQRRIRRAEMAKKAAAQERKAARTEARRVGTDLSRKVRSGKLARQEIATKGLELRMRGYKEQPPVDFIRFVERTTTSLRKILHPDFDKSLLPKLEQIAKWRDYMPDSKRRTLATVLRGVAKRAAEWAEAFEPAETKAEPEAQDEGAVIIDIDEYQQKGAEA
jgi:chemotaxis protein histidine kinase CheA